MSKPKKKSWLAGLLSFLTYENAIWITLIVFIVLLVIAFIVSLMIFYSGDYGNQWTLWLW